MAPEAVPSPETRVDRTLELGILLCDRLLEDLLQRHSEALEGRWNGTGHQIHTTSSAVTSAFTVATGSRTFQPKRISWS